MPYTKLPITIEILDYTENAANKFTTKSKLTFVGPTTKAVQSELDKVKTGTYNKKVVDGWLKNHEQLLHINNDKVGGDDMFNIADIENILEDDTIPDIVDEDYSEPAPDVIKVTKAAVKKYKPTHTFIQNTVFPEDTLMDLKHKIFLQTGVHAYKQHIFYVDDGNTHILGYDMFAPIPLNMSIINEYNTGTAKDFYTGIFINSKLYDVRDSIRVDPMDTFTSMGGFMDISIPITGPSGSVGPIYLHKPQTKFYMISVDEFLLANKAHYNSVPKIQKDTIYYSLVIKYFPMMSLEVFYTYLNDINNIKNIYPKLSPSRGLLQIRYDKQHEFLDKCNDFHTNNTSIKNFEIALIYTRLHITKLITTISVINLREIFDKIYLNESVVIASIYIKLPDEIQIIKVFNKLNNPEQYNISHVKRNSIQLVILLPELIKVGSMDYNKLLYDNNNYIKLIINDDGTYNIDGFWKISKLYSYNDVYNTCKKIIDPVIHNINKDSVYKYPEMSIENTRFSKLNVSIIWKVPVQESYFKMLRDTIVNDIIPANIISINDMPTIGRMSAYHYYWNKGMYSNNINNIKSLVYSNNYYSYLISQNIYDKYEHLYIKNKTCSIYHRYSDIKVDVNNIDESELGYIFRHISYILNDVYAEYKPPTSIKVSKSIRGLQEQDPELYKYRGSDPKKTYSIICQKPHQPIIISEDEFKKSPGNKAKLAEGKIQKYKNMSNGDTIYYSCPGTKYPYLKFLTGYHPRGYCIPCCQKIGTDNMNEYRKYQYDTCASKYKFEESDIAEYNDHVSKSDVTSAYMTSLNRHITVYGKSINISRFSRLPEATLEMLFYDNVSSTYMGIEDECVNFDNMSYLLYGCQQNTPNMSDIGMFYICIHIMSMSPKEFISALKSTMNDPKKVQLFHNLLDGNIYKYYNNTKELINDVVNVFSEEGFSNFNHWNDLLLDILWIYFNIRPIIFEDSGKINLILPKGITHPNEFIDLQDEAQEYIIIVKNSHGIYPVYIVDISKIVTAVNNDNAINTRIYKVEHIIIEILYGVVKDNIQQEATNLNIYNLTEFVGSSDWKTYKIKDLFINSDNTCYGCTFTISNKVFYIPLVSSSYNIKRITNKLGYNINLIQDTIDYKLLHKDSLVLLNDFMGYFNTFIKKISAIRGSYKMSLSDNTNEVVPIINYIEPTRLLIYNNKCIGIISNGMHYYIYPSNISSCKKLYPLAEEYILEYDPIAINKVLYKNTKPSTDYHLDNINKAVYEKYLYQLILMELFMSLSKETDTQIRSKILKIINKISNNNYISKLDEIKVLAPNDINTIKNIIYQYKINNNRYKGLTGIKAITKIFENTKFNFDSKTINKIRNILDTEPDFNVRTKLNLTLLKKVIMSIIHIGNIKPSMKMPNILNTCPNNDYCHKNKLIVPKKYLEEVLPVIAMEMSNIYVANSLYYVPFIDNIINMLRFSKHKHEEIYIKYM